MIKGPWGTIFDADMSGTLVRILAVSSSVMSSVEMLCLL